MRIVLIIGICWLIAGIGVAAIFAWAKRQDAKYRGRHR